MDTALEAATDSGVELPWDVGGSEDKNPGGIVTDTVHLYKHLGFDSSAGFTLAFAAGTAEGVDFINKDDGWLIFAGHSEQLFYEAGRC